MSETLPGDRHRRAIVRAFGLYVFRAYSRRLTTRLGGIVKRSLAMVLCSCERAIARAFGVDDATSHTL
jgi:hypothetical protein